MKKLKYLIDSFFWIVFSKIIPAQNLGALYFFGKIVGLGFYALAGNRRKIMEKELRLVFPKERQKNIRRTMRNAFINFCASEIEQVHFPHLNAKNISELITIHGKDILDQALARGKGVIAIHPHFGSYLLIIPALGYNGYKVNQIAARGNPPSEMIKKTPGLKQLQRTGFNLKTYQHRVSHFEDCLPCEFISPKGSNALRALYRKTKENEIIAVSGTGRVGQTFVPVNLCERQALLASGPIKLSARTGAVLLPMFIVRGKDQRHRLVVEEPIEIDQQANEEAIKYAVQKFADLLTGYIKKHPEHFAMRLWRMRVLCNLDDHPFFTDYAPDDSWKKYLVQESEK